MFSEYLNVAIAAVQQAGYVHQKYFRKNVRIQSKGQSFDLLTTADLEAEKTIISLIREKYPEHNIVAEESDHVHAGSPYTWVIDPLDGTNNFAFGIPQFCASVACVTQGEVIAGAIYDVVKQELFCAEKGKGATLNGQMISVHDAQRLDQSILVTGFYYDRGQAMRDNLKTIERFFDAHIIGIRRLGAAALDLCYVACGRFCGYWEFFLNPWDFAAGKLILEEAGGKITDPEGKALHIKPACWTAAIATLRYSENIIRLSA